MKIGDVKNIKIAKKYSTALINTAVEENKTDKIYQDLFFVDETIKTNSQLSEFLYNPVIKLEDKCDAVRKLFSPHIDKISIDFILMLLENRRLNVLEEIVNQYAIAYNKHMNILKPQIITAIELNEEQKNKIINKLEAKLNKKIVPEYQVIPDIIGGLIVEIEDKTIDCSIKTKFEVMKKQLTKGNSYGNN